MYYLNFNSLINQNNNYAPYKLHEYVYFEKVVRYTNVQICTKMHNILNHANIELSNQCYKYINNSISFIFHLERITKKIIKKVKALCYFCRIK